MAILVALGQIPAQRDPPLRIAPARQVVVRHGSGEPAVTYHVDSEGTVNGPYMALWPDGRVKVSGIYRDGRKHGAWTHYGDASVVIEHYSDGAMLDRWEVLNGD